MSIQPSFHLLLAAALLLVASSDTALAASVDTTNSSPSESSSSSSNATVIAVSVVGGVGAVAIALFVGYFIHTRRRSIAPHVAGEKPPMPRSSSLSSSSSPSPGKISRYLAFWSSPSSSPNKGKKASYMEDSLSGSTRGGASGISPGIYHAPSLTPSPQGGVNSSSGLSDAERERRAGHRTSGRWSIPYPYPAAPSPIYAPDGKYLSASSRERMKSGPFRSKTPERGMSTDSVGGGSVYDEVHLETVPSYMSGGEPAQQPRDLAIPEEGHLHPDILAKEDTLTEVGPIRESAFFGYQDPLQYTSHPSPSLPGMERASSVPVDPQLLTLKPPPSSSSSSSDSAPKRFSLGLGLKDLGDEMRRVISGGDRKEDGTREKSSREEISVITMDPSSSPTLAPLPSRSRNSLPSTPVEVHKSPMTPEGQVVQAPMEWSFGQGRRGLPRLTSGSDGEEELDGRRRSSGGDRLGEKAGGGSRRRRGGGGGPNGGGDMVIGAPHPQRASFCGVMSWEAGANLQRSGTLKRQIRTTTRRTTASPTLIQSSDLQEEEEGMTGSLAHDDRPIASKSMESGGVGGEVKHV
ncbi:MAG: hypothetical protein DHS80DRAFT_23144 [Piptocephalis tieghemiana]|nr:MAG: hypothetical protein DHS80DRAFT_23144 [Piptocephalis tieghemiana]